MSRRDRFAWKAGDLVAEDEKDETRGSEKPRDAGEKPDEKAGEKK